jgi:glycosyltransferase involved in cell wall biosynthesis
MNPDITVAFMTHNEKDEFEWLMERLTTALDVIGEIVIVDDYSDPDFVAAVRSYERTMPIRFFQRPLKKDFAAQRNYMKSLCQGRLIFYLDPDELPSEQILRGLPKILEMMERLDIDACQLPRLNISCEGDGAIHPATIDLASDNLTTFWEDQTRILRNLPHLRWTMRLNEYLDGIRRGYRFPRELNYALLHSKTKGRQQRQRVFYRSMHERHISRIKNSIVKRLPWRRDTVWIAAEVPI